MNRSIKRLALLVCGLGVATAASVVGYSNSAQAAGPQYKVVQVGNPAQLEGILNSHAAQGWSFAGNVAGGIILKR